MAQTTLGPDTINTSGDLPSNGDQAPLFSLTNNDLATVNSQDFAGKNVILNIFPSIDTGVCATSVRTFNQHAAKLDDTVVLCISKDLPFAMKRFCGAEGIDSVITLSDYKNPNFANDYGVLMTDGKLEGLMARAVVLIDKNGQVAYSEMVPAIGQEPNYDAVLQAIQ